MRVVYLLVSLLTSGNCFDIPIPSPTYSEKLLECVIDIIAKYFTEAKQVTYVGNRVRDEELLKAVNDASIVSVVSKRGSTKLFVPHQAYLISASNATFFAKHFINVTRESTWNPQARFLVIVRDLNERNLKIMFDTFLKLHANNVLLVNATDDAHLYTYNPFDNYNCGRRYDTITRFGKCLQAQSHNLYPEKLVTGLQNCTLNVLITQWPPYTVLAGNESFSSPPALRNGVEPYLLNIIGEMLGFNLNLINDYGDADEFSTVSADMQAAGSLKKIQDNEVDMHISGMILLPSRAAAFSYIYGHLVYTDEIRFVVQRAKNVRPWRNTYLEFELTVWLLLALSLVIYSILAIMLLRTDDKSYVVLILLDNLVLHGRNVKSGWAVKCVFIIWMWFAYLVNSFYQSSLVSLTTHPALEYQISSEEDINYYQLKPCLSSIMGRYYLESVQSSTEFDDSDVCHRLLGSVEAVAKSDNLYTLLLYGIYKYNEQDFFDDYGNPRVISLPKPYSKVIYAAYLYKGFPLIDKLCHKSIQLRENGLVEKGMRDMNYLRKITHSFKQREFVGRLAIPWLIYAFGCTLSTITFIIEIILKRRK